ncbi:MAG: hypothetical protein GY797_31875 [Deltaproteobacteria bacterium]|nr:hypothetical protein [Deltaproteobacteria bacterium]
MLTGTDVRQSPVAVIHHFCFEYRFTRCLRTTIFSMLDFEKESSPKCQKDSTFIAQKLRFSIKLVLKIEKSPAALLHHFSFQHRFTCIFKQRFFLLILEHEEIFLQMSRVVHLLVGNEVFFLKIIA